MTPMTYIVKAGAATLPELSALTRTDKPSVDRLKQMATEEMNALGIQIDVPTMVITK